MSIPDRMKRKDCFSGVVSLETRLGQVNNEASRQKLSDLLQNALSVLGQKQEKRDKTIVSHLGQIEDGFLEQRRHLCLLECD